jgi:hypothetical protein
MLREALPHNDPALAAWMRFRKKLARAGVSVFPHEGPRDLTRRAARLLFRRSAEIERIGELYLGLRYGGKSGVVELQRLVREFRPK